MKTWIFGKEIPYFKPLRHELTDDILKKIEISQDLADAGWTKTTLLELLNKKAFLDPHYPNYIRTSDQLITIQHYLVEKIDSIHTQTKELKERLPIFYNDFIKTNTLILSDEWKERGASPLWVIPDLRAEGTFIEKKGEVYCFETRHFIYDINKNFEVIAILVKSTKSPIKTIHWQRESCCIETDLEQLILCDDYTDWLLCLLHQKENPWTCFKSLPEKIGDKVEQLQGQWVINPKIWKELSISSLEEQNYFVTLFKSDWTNNAFALHNKQGLSHWVGWRFRYIWDGFILDTIETPDGKKIQSVERKEGFLFLNDHYSTAITKPSPEVITDLTVGNLTRMIPEESLSGIELHPHAVQRYEERINEHSYLHVMLRDILKNAYNLGEVVNGAHNDDRRKIETDRYGYVISNELVISVWDKKNTKRKKTNNRRNRDLRHLEHMINLFDQLKN